MGRSVLIKKGEDKLVSDAALKNIQVLRKRYPEVFEAYRGVRDDELIEVDREYLREARARARHEMLRNVEVLVDLRDRLLKEKGRERDVLRAVTALYDIATGEIEGKDDDKGKYDINLLVAVLTGDKESVDIKPSERKR